MNEVILFGDRGNGDRCCIEKLISKKSLLQCPGSPNDSPKLLNEDGWGSLFWLARGQLHSL